MKELLLIAIGSAIVNNVVLSQFLGICPFLGVSKKTETAAGMGGAVVFVITISSFVTGLIYKYILANEYLLSKGIDLTYLQTIVFILVIAALVQFVEMFLKKSMPALYKSLGVYLPLITTNCAVLGVALTNVTKEYNILQGVVNGFATAFGFLIAIVIMAGLREGLEPIDDVDVPIVPVVNERGEPAGYIDTSIQLSDKYRPWYSSRFANIEEVADYWMKNYNTLKEKTELFTDAFYATTLPAEVVEAVAANLTILKSPTIFRQYDGRMWNWEGCGNEYGSCYGSCTHVWNYAQAIPHLFPKMERTLRETEFFVSQAKNGHQAFRSALPIRPIRHNFHAAADGQLGGIMKVYRDWHIYGNDEWLKLIYSYVQNSLDYCINTWDPKRKGVIEEPHHNTYDIEFWGPSGMINSYYTGALQAFVAMGEHLMICFLSS